MTGVQTCALPIYDLQMDGIDGSDITIAGDFIGLSYKTENGNPNASSSIINNEPLNDVGASESTIHLNGNIMVPGIAFSVFDETMDTHGASRYYPTYESVSAKVLATFNAYLFDTADPYDEIRYRIANDSGGMDEFSFKDMRDTAHALDFAKMKENFRNEMSPVPPVAGPDPFITGVYGNSDMKGFSLGGGMMHPDASSAYATVYIPGTATELDGQGAVSAEFDAIKSTWEKLFVAKTRHFGFEGTGARPAKALSALHDTTAVAPDDTSATSLLLTNNIYYYPGDVTWDTNSNPSSGIILCKGDLTLTGNGTFTGIVISNGDVRLDGNCTIVYSNDIVEGILKNSRHTAARKLFSPGTVYGAEVYAFFEDYDSTSGEKAFLKRYDVLYWRERQIMP